MSKANPSYVYEADELKTSFDSDASELVNLVMEAEADDDEKENANKSIKHLKPPATAHTTTGARLNQSPKQMPQLRPALQSVQASSVEPNISDGLRLLDEQGSVASHLVPEKQALLCCEIPVISDCYRNNYCICSVFQFIPIFAEFMNQTGAPSIRLSSVIRLQVGDHDYVEYQETARAPMPRSQTPAYNARALLSLSFCRNSSKMTVPSVVGTPLAYRSPGIYLKNSRRYDPSFKPFDKRGFSDELVLEIFERLSRKSLGTALRVCHRFYRIGSRSTLWKAMDLGDRKISELQLHALMSRGTQLFRVNRAQITSDGGLNAMVLPPQMSPLTHLDLSAATFMDASVVDGILSRCRSLVCLSLELGKVNDAAMKALARNDRLEQLNLAMCEGLTADGINAVIDGCRRLKALNVGWTRLPAHAVSRLCERLTDTCERLNISGCLKNALRDADVALLVQRCRRLAELDISDCALVTEVGLAEILACAHVRTLTANRSYGIQPNNFSNCVSLQELNIFGCVTDAGMLVLKERLGKVSLNAQVHSTIARPTVGVRRTNIWGHAVRDTLAANT